MAIGRLEGRIVLITGASRGIGRAVALRFAKEGAQLILCARTQGALEELDDQILELTGSNATLVPLDLRDFDAIDHMAAAVFERFKRLDVLVGNGSKVKVLYKPFDWKFAGKSGTSLDLQAVQVIDLVPYGEDFDVSDGYVAEGNNEEF